MKLILISGLSGSGKSIALNVLEDAGYYCVDNLPATLLYDVVNFLEDAGQSRAAVSVDARSAALSALPETVARLKAQGIDCRVLVLDASHESLMRRFSETRRRHPLTSSGTGLTLAEAIEQERTMLAGAAGLGHHIDTSGLLPKALRDWIRALLEIGTGPVTLLFESFSYGQGIPLDADWVIDARMLPNPHYDDKLRPFTGRDAPVIEFLERQEMVKLLYADVRQFLARWLPELVRDNRSYLNVAIGCTGGRHRSVYLAEKLASSFRVEWPVLVRHRGLARSGQEEAQGAPPRTPHGE